MYEVRFSKNRIAYCCKCEWKIVYIDLTGKFCIYVCKKEIF